MNVPVQASALTEFSSRIESGLRTALEADPDYRRYLECVARSSRKQCLPILSNAIYRAITVGTDNYFGTHSTKDVYNLVGEDAFWRLIAARATSNDEITRISALLLMNRTTDIEPHSLPAEAYRNLADKTDPEVQLLLQENANLPLPDQTAVSEAYSRAADPDATSRVRLAATRALADPGNSADLSRLVTEVTSEPSVDSIVTGLGLPFALGGCGIACDDTLRQLAASRDASKRRIAYQSVLFMANPEARQQYEHEFEQLTPATAEQFDAEMESAKNLGFPG